MADTAVAVQFRAADLVVIGRQPQAQEHEGKERQIQNESNPALLNRVCFHPGSLLRVISAG
jgi:hypothetical protein